MASLRAEVGPARATCQQGRVSGKARWFSPFPHPYLVPDWPTQGLQEDPSGKPQAEEPCRAGWL